MCMHPCPPVAVGTFRLWSILPVRISARDGQQTGVWTNQLERSTPFVAKVKSCRVLASVSGPPSVLSRSSVNTNTKFGLLLVAVASVSLEASVIERIRCNNNSTIDRCSFGRSMCCGIGIFPKSLLPRISSL